MAALFWGMIFGSIGVGYIVYGRRQSNGIALVCGIGLCAFPYFIPNWILMLFVGGILMAAPFLIKF